MKTFEREYFVQSNTGNYKDYRERKFSKLAEDIINILNLKVTDKILDFGCATGGLLFELKKRGFTKIKGTDLSYWAVEYGRKKYGFVNEELQYHNVNLLTIPFDVLFFLDVLEHVPTVDEIIKFLTISNANKVVIRVPISKREGEPYVFDVSNNDVTHVQCHTKTWWIELVETCGYELDTFLQGEAIYDSDGVFAGVFRKCV